MGVLQSTSGLGCAGSVSAARGPRGDTVLHRPHLHFLHLPVGHKARSLQRRLWLPLRSWEFSVRGFITRGHALCRQCRYLSSFPELEIIKLCVARKLKRYGGGVAVTLFLRLCGDPQKNPPYLLICSNYVRATQHCVLFFHRCSKALQCIAKNILL